MLADKDDVLYMDASLIDTAGPNPPGAVCGKCALFIADTSACEILAPPQVSGEMGVCGLFVGGQPTTSEFDQPLQLVPDIVAGYFESGPTMCGNCSHFIKPMHCRIVKGKVEAGGCCNAWSALKRPTSDHTSD